MASSNGLVVKADGSWLRSHGFKPRHPILDGCKQFASYYIKDKLKIKVAKWGPPKSIYKKKIFGLEKQIDFFTKEEKDLSKIRELTDDRQHPLHSLKRSKIFFVNIVQDVIHKFLEKTIGKSFSFI